MPILRMSALHIADCPDRPDAADCGMASLARLASDKRQFANRALDFANRARTTPAFPVLELACIAMAGLAAISGAFGTDALPPMHRAAFWFALMAWSGLKWRLWFAWRVRKQTDWARASAIGALLLNLPLPLEIEAATWLVGANAQVGEFAVWLEALAISAVIAALVWPLRRVLAPARERAQAADPGPLVRAGARLERIGAVRAEDHYCRVYLADRSSRLVLCRFGDALAELAAMDGERVHRSVWVADWAVDSAHREGRAWRLEAAGELLPVSSAYLARARQRGWLNRRSCRRPEPLPAVGRSA
jgi:hypothetical protein